jgi:hypothetical protein
MYKHWLVFTKVFLGQGGRCVGNVVHRVIRIAGQASVLLHLA